MNDPPEPGILYYRHGGLCVAILLDAKLELVKELENLGNDVNDEEDLDQLELLPDELLQCLIQV